MSTTQAQYGRNDDSLTPKEILSRKLGHARNNFLLSYVANILLDSPKADEIIKGGKICTRDNHGGIIEILDLNRVRTMLSNDERKNVVLKHQEMFQLRMAGTEPFELIYAYCKNTCTCEKMCKETCNMNKFKKLDFFHFGRILRNCLVHNRRLTFNQNDKEKILPVFWQRRRKTFTKDMDGEYLNRSHFDHIDVPDLFNDYITFVKDSLD